MHGTPVRPFSASAFYLPQYNKSNISCNRNFLSSIDVHEAMSQPMLNTTRTYIDGMESLYSSGNHASAVGASFGLENMAITMWDHLIPGLARLRSRYPEMDMTYFTFHREL